MDTPTYKLVVLVLCQLSVEFGPRHFGLAEVLPLAARTLCEAGQEAKGHFEENG